MVEFVIIMPVFLLLVASIFEIALMYRSKALLNAATFEAAQAGALSNARQSAINDGLAQGMMPLYVRSRDIVGVGAAYAQTRLMVGVPLPFGGVEIVSPTKDVFKKFRQRQVVKTTADTAEKMQWVIPNDNLMWRSAATKPVTIDGETIQMNVQDANLLKVKSYWCHKLVTPVASRIIWSWTAGPMRIISGGTISAESLKCNLLGAARDGYYVAITSHAVARMHSPVLEADLD